MYFLCLREVLSHYDLIIKLPAVSVSSTNVFSPIARSMSVSVSIVNNGKQVMYWIPFHSTVIVISIIILDSKSEYLMQEKDKGRLQNASNLELVSGDHLVV